MRIISVVIGEENSKNRFDDTRTMFDYAFANYTQTPIVKANEVMEEYANIHGGKQSKVAVYPMYSAYAFAKRGEQIDVKTEIVFYKTKAPVNKGEQVGELIVYNNGIERERVPLLAYEKVEKANVWDKLQDIGKAWNNRK